MDHFDEEASGWDDQPHRVERAQIVAEAIRRAIPLRDAPTAVEIGGGTGLLSRSLAADLGPVTVTDVAPGMVAPAEAALDDPRYAGWRAVRYDAEHDPLPPDRYDLVLSLLALHHMGDVGAVVRTAFDLLRPGGHVALADLDRDPDGAFHADVEGFDGHDGFDRVTVTGWLADAGFVDVAVTTAHVEPMLVDGGERHFPAFLATGRRPDPAP